VPINLASIADLLRPGLCGLAEQYNKLDADIICNYVNDSLELRIDGHPSELFSRKELDDNIYKAEFFPRVMRMLQEGGK